MNNKKISTLTIITCLTILIASNLIAMDEARKHSQDSDDNIEESQLSKGRALEIECIICREPVEELAPQQNTHQERGMRLGCIQGENNHYFHTACLNFWLTGATKSKSQCPSCKQYLIVPPIDFEEIFAAINNNTIDNLQTLIERATINVRDEEDDTTALDCAAYNGKDISVAFLLTNGANPNLQNLIGWTALHYAAYRGHLAVVELLLTHGANPNLQTNNGTTALHFATSKGSQPIVELLLARGATPNLQNINGETALHIAAVHGHQPIVELLLTRGATPNLQNINGETPLYYAVIEEHQPIVELLLTHGANPNLQNNFSCTALHWAAENGHLPTVELLLANGANVSLKNDKGYNALQLAKTKGHQNIIDAINSHLSLPVYALLEKQFPSATIIQENNTLTVNNITVTFSYDTERYNPFTDDNYYTIDIMVGDNTEPLKTYLTQALGSTTHKLSIRGKRLWEGTCWHLGTSNWQLTYRDASWGYSNYSNHSHIKPNTPLRFYLSAPDDADFQNYINFCVGLVAATEGLTHE